MVRRNFKLDVPAVSPLNAYTKIFSYIGTLQTYILSSSQKARLRRGLSKSHFQKFRLQISKKIKRGNGTDARISYEQAGIANSKSLKLRRKK